MNRRLAVFLALLAAPAAAHDTPPSPQATFPGCPDWSHRVAFVNNCTSPVTVFEVPGCFPASNPDPPFNGNNCWPQQAGGGFTLAPNGQSGFEKVVSIMSCWSGNYGVDCAGCKVKIATLAEFTFDGGLDSDYDKLPGLLDTYDVSLVDGFALPVEIEPDSSVQPGGGNCHTAGCEQSPVCPSTLDNGGGSCMSPCKYAVSSGMSTADQEKYCCVCSMTESAPCVSDPKNPNQVPAACVGKYGCSPFSPPGSSNPGSACCPWSGPGQPCQAASADRAWDSWAQSYIAAVHDACPNEYAWQYDDLDATKNCQGQGSPMAYTITFCPSPASPGSKG